MTDPFLTTFYYVEKRDGILHKNRGEGFEKSYIPLHGGREGVKNCKNHPYVINEWPLKTAPCDCVLFNQTSLHFSVRVFPFFPPFFVLPILRYLTLHEKYFSYRHCCSPLP